MTQIQQLFLDGRYKEARKLALALLKEKPNDLSVAAILAHCELDGGVETDGAAASSLKGILSNNNSWAYGWYLLGILNFNERHFNDARGALENAVNLAPNHTKYIVALAYACEELNQLSDAKARFEEALLLGIGDREKETRTAYKDVLKKMATASSRKNR